MNHKISAGSFHVHLLGCGALGNYTLTANESSAKTQHQTVVWALSAAARITLRTRFEVALAIWPLPEGGAGSHETNKNASMVIVCIVQWHAFPQRENLQAFFDGLLGDSAALPAAWLIQAC